MEIKEKKTREPLFHITKNDALPAWKTLVIRVAAIFVALVIIGVLSVVLIKQNPFKIYGILFSGAFLDVWTTLQNTAILLIFGLIAIPAFRMKFWNMGANGQVLVGCLAAIACMKFLTGKLPNVVIMLLMIVTSILASVIWSVIPAFFKAKFNTNETLFTLMMNYIAIALVDFCVVWWNTDPQTGKLRQTVLGVVNLFKHEAWFPNIGNKYVLTILVSLILTAILYVYIRYTKHGFEVGLVGESVNTARYAGINVSKVIVRTLVLSGVIAGIMGVLYAGAIEHTVTPSVGGKGFTAILVAWLANFDPLVMLPTSFFVVYLNSGAEQLNTRFQLGSNDYANIIVGIVFFCVIASEFFVRYKIHLNQHLQKKLNALLKKETKEEVQQ